SVSMSTSGLGPKGLFGLRRVGARARLVNALCRGNHSTPLSDWRLVAGDRTFGNAHVHVGGAGRERQDLLRDRQFQTQVAAVPETKLRARREHQGELAVAGEDLADSAAQVE